MTLCACGCGKEIKEGNKFINHHHSKINNGMRGTHHTEEHKRKQSESMKRHQFNKKCCKICNNEFIPKGGNQTYCNDCIENCKNKTQGVINGINKRRNRRREIQDFWGRNGRLVWKQSEKLAINIINKEGFTNIESMVDVYPFGFFDIKAIDNSGKICLFQVTTRTHTGIKKQRKFANILGINNFYILFIKTDLTAYILKRVIDTKNNYSIDNLNEVKMI